MINFISKYFIYVPMIIFFVLMLYNGIRKLKKSKFDFLKELFIIVVFFYSITYLSCHVIKVPLLKENNLDELLICEGYCYGKGGRRAPNTFTIIGNEGVTQQVYFFQLCDNTSDIAEKYNNKWIKIWYDRANNYVYQMEHEGEIQYSLDYCNNNVNDLNFKIHIFPIVFLTCLFGIVLFS